MKYRAFRFSDEDMDVVLEHLEELSSKVRIEYDLVAGSDILVVPAYLQDQIWGLIKTYDIPAEIVEVGSFADLDPKEQAKHRGFISKLSA